MIDADGMMSVQVDGKTERRPVEVREVSMLGGGSLHMPRPVTRSDEILVEMVGGGFVIVQGRAPAPPAACYDVPWPVGEEGWHW